MYINYIQYIYVYYKIFKHCYITWDDNALKSQRLPNKNPNTRHGRPPFKLLTRGPRDSHNNVDYSHFPWMPPST